MSVENLVARHALRVDVEPAFAWSFWTTVANWDDPPASFSLSGPFTAGSVGTTTIPGAPPFSWTILACADGRATIEIPLDDAAIHFAWTFESDGGSGTIMTQRITLTGARREAYLAEAKEGLEQSIAGGMSRLADGMVRARGVRRAPELPAPGRRVEIR